MNTEYSILKVLVYFDIFHFPLTTEEIIRFMDTPINERQLEEQLAVLCKKHLVWNLDGYYSLRNDHSLISRRKEGYNKALPLLEKSGIIARRLTLFPFVRAVGVTGSISKYFADESADIDYIIITKTNRLWLARTFLHIYKKIPFLNNRNRFYCMNYFLDEDNLEIEEKNIYTATELITMIPVTGKEIMTEFYHANKWAFEYFPNNNSEISLAMQNKKDPLIKSLFEFFFNNKFGDWLDNYFFRITTNRWKLKEEQGRLNTKGEIMGLRTSKHCSKPNPEHFHDWFLSGYRDKLNEFKSKWELQTT